MVEFIYFSDEDSGILVGALLALSEGIVLFHYYDDLSGHLSAGYCVFDKIIQLVSKCHHI